LQAILYYLLLPLLYLLSLLPFPILYLLSDLLNFILFRLIGYRKKVIIENLRRSFPQKSAQEIDAIARGFYRHFCDILLETFKTLTISRTAMLKHCYMHPDALALMERLAAEKKNLICVMGHMGNWEWAGNAFSLSSPHKLYVIYHPLSNKYFDGLMYRLRSRFGSIPVAMKDTFRTMVAHRNELNATAFIADQSPDPRGAYWMNFLQQDTPVFKGTEKLAGKLGYTVLFMSVYKTKRGYYYVNAQELEGDFSAEGALTKAHTLQLEKDIIRQPEIWLWSHRRWKHKRS
jgi:Kdo2-lipid IVA lauroyltransferase/acyltransferase